MAYRKMKLNNKGNLYAFLVLLMSIAVIGLLYVTIFPVIKTALPEAAKAAGVNESEDGQKTLDYITWHFDVYPIVALIGLTLAALVYSQKKQWGQG